MRSLPCIFVCLISFTVSAAFAQVRTGTEAQQDGLLGPVESVFTVMEQTPPVQWQQPDGPPLVIPVWCHVCDYDPSGYRTRSGDFVDGKFVGELITLERDAAGHVTARHMVDAASQEKVRDERMGPEGRTELDAFSNGKQVAHQTFSYDASGDLADRSFYDGDGNPQGRVTTVRSSDGSKVDNSSWSGDGTLQWRQTYDVAAKTDEITVNDKTGAPVLTRSFQKGGVASFWEASDEANRFGQRFTSAHGDGNVDVYECHRGAACKVSRVHYEYAAGNQNPVSAEWRDASGNLQWAAYYEYEFDSFHNWTHRKVWVVSPEQKDRVLYEEASRRITYWQ